MNLGAEPKKIAILGGLLAAGGYIFYANVLAGPETDTRKHPAPVGQAVSPAASPAIAPPNIHRAKVPVRGAASGEFKPSLKPKPDEKPNYATVDPTLRLDLLAKVQSVNMEGGSRSLFQFSTAPAPATPKGPQTDVTIRPGARMYGPEPPPKPPVPPPPPPPPAITLKFYGYSTPRADGTKRAFFLDGDDIFVAAEGELVKKRYRVVQIGVNSVIMEDTEYKNNRQTLVIQQEQAG
jgi:hypothetical protein